MKKKDIIIGGLLVALVLLLGIIYKTMKSENSYGEKVQYSKDQVLEFPDFNLRFIGERTVGVPQYGGRYFLYHDFEVFTDSEKKTISWSSGTGAIAPASFKFNNKDFLLEMSGSEISGRLAENEIIIWTKDGYDSEVAKHYN